MGQALLLPCAQVCARAAVLHGWGAARGCSCAYDVPALAAESRFGQSQVPSRKHVRASLNCSSLWMLDRFLLRVSLVSLCPWLVMAGLRSACIDSATGCIALTSCLTWLSGSRERRERLGQPLPSDASCSRKGIAWRAIRVCPTLRAKRKASTASTRFTSLRHR